jgi:hypothetical protein
MARATLHGSRRSCFAQRQRSFKRNRVSDNDMRTRNYHGRPVVLISNGAQSWPAPKDQVRYPPGMCDEKNDDPSKPYFCVGFPLACGHIIACNLNIHFHMLFLDGVYSSNGSPLRFRQVKAPSGIELTQLTHTIAARVGRYLDRSCASLRPRH